MNIREIIPGVHYVGVNDRTTRLFEALWPLPYGVSYNSYIVKGCSKTALIDTVELGHSREFMQRVKLEAGIEKIDYLIINHMEPDHSGAIPSIIDAFPDIKIIGNKITIPMVKGFYHIKDDNRFITVADNDTLDLGGCTLLFRTTPMVHWPETMMTLCVEKKILFSGDVFGTFGALAGGIIDRDMDCSHYLDEMYRYYSNIVGKYGRFALAAVSKIKDLDYDYIGSTHGPIWHEMIPEVMEITRRLASYEPEKGVTVIYGSMYGNTAEIAETFACELSKRGVKKIAIHNASVSSLSDMISDAFRYEGLIVGAPTYNGTLFPAVKQFTDAMVTREIRNKVVATFGSYTWAPASPKILDETFGSLNLKNAGNIAIKQTIDDETAAKISEIADTFVGMLTLK